MNLPLVISVLAFSSRSMHPSHPSRAATRRRKRDVRACMVLLLQLLCCVVINSKGLQHMRNGVEAEHKRLVTALFLFRERPPTS